MLKSILSPITGILLAGIVLVVGFELSLKPSDISPAGTFRTTNLIVDNTITATGGDTTIGGAGQVRVTGGNGVQINTVSGTLTLPRLLSFNGDPNGTVTAVVGSTLMDTLTPAVWQNTDGATAWTVLAAGSSVTTAITTATNALAYGWFGTGIDGSPSFDGSTTVLGLAPVANTYTLVRDVWLDIPTCLSGVTIKPAGFRIFVKTDFGGPASGTCTIDDSGPAAVGQAKGTARTDNTFVGSSASTVTCPGRNGGNGGPFGPGNNGTSHAKSACAPRLAGSGGNGGGVAGNGGTSAAPTCPAVPMTSGPDFINIGLQAWTWSGGTPYAFCGGSGAGGGGSDNLGGGVTGGGGGGAGGGYNVFVSKHVTNPTHVLITAAGGNGANGMCTGGTVSAGGGGGGGGGYVVMVIGYGTAPTTSILGGTHGNGCGVGTNGVDGGNGQLIAFQMN